MPRLHQSPASEVVALRCNHCGQVFAVEERHLCPPDVLQVTVDQLGDRLAQLRAIVARGIESGNRDGGYYDALRDCLNLIDGTPDTDLTDKQRVAAIRQAYMVLEERLGMRQNGGIAASKFIEAVASVLGSEA